MEIILRIFLCFSGLYQVTEDLVKAGTSEAAVNGVGGSNREDGARREQWGKMDQEGKGKVSVRYFSFYHRLPLD